MPVETKKPNFFRGIGKVAKAIGIETAPTVNPNAPTLGKVETTQVDFSIPQSLGDKSVDSLSAVPGVPAPVTENSVASVPPVPQARPVEAVGSVPPTPAVVPDAVQNAFANEPEDRLNPTFPAPTPEPTTTTPQSFEAVEPTVVPAERPDVSSIPSAEPQNVAPVEPIVTPEAPSAPTIPEPVQEVQNTVMPEAPVTPEEPLVNNPEPEPVVVSPSMATPEMVPSDHVVETPTEEPEVRQEAATVPPAVENAFTEEPEDHLDPTRDTSAQNESDETPQDNEFNVKINPVADRLIKENPEKFIKVDEKGDFVLDEEELDAAIFAQEVLEDPKVSTLFNKLKEKYGVTPETAMYALKTLLK